jgi:hypothetical protein
MSYCGEDLYCCWGTKNSNCDCSDQSTLIRIPVVDVIGKVVAAEGGSLTVSPFSSIIPLTSMLAKGAAGLSPSTVPTTQSTLLAGLPTGSSPSSTSKAVSSVGTTTASSTTPASSPTGSLSSASLDAGAISGIVAAAVSTMGLGLAFYVCCTGERREKRKERRRQQSEHNNGYQMPTYGWSTS